MQERFRKHATHDPFAITPNPRVYVPRAATENARKELLRSACNPAKTTALIGPPGLGKTLLLNLLAEEAPEDLKTVYLPYAALPPEELCGWALELLELSGEGDPVAALRAHSWDLRQRGSSLLLLIDDAASMPIATARWAGTLVEDSGGCLRLAIAASDNAAGNRIIAAIGGNFDIVHLDVPMTETETKKYIDGRLALARVPDSIRARFDDQTVGMLHRISGGIPRRLHAAAMAILQDAPEVLAEHRDEAAAAPADASAESATIAQTIGVPSEERRVSNRRAEPEGVEVRVGLGDQQEPRGRRAEDRIEALPRPSELDSGGSDEPAAPTEAGDDEGESSKGTSSTPPPMARRVAATPRRKIFLVALLVAFAAIAIPLIRSLLSEPRPVAGANPQVNLSEPTREQLREPLIQEGFRDPTREGARGSTRARIDEPIALGGPSDSVTQREVGENRRPAGSEALAVVESPPLEGPVSENRGPFAVQINANPWANVEVDGVDLGVTPLANIPLVRGAHVFRVRMPDGRVIDRTVEIDADRRFISFE